MDQGSSRRTTEKAEESFDINACIEHGMTRHRLALHQVLSFEFPRASV